MLEVELLLKSKCQKKWSLLVFSSVKVISVAIFWSLQKMIWKTPSNTLSIFYTLFKWKLLTLFGRLIVFAPFLIIIIILLSFFPRTMNLSTADLRNYCTEFHETWWSYRYMFLVDPKVFRFVVNGVKAIFLGVQRRWGLL